LNPPARAVVFSYDEKTQCQALDRTQPSLPLKPGRAGTMTHDYKRNGTIEVFAAMNIATGQVFTDLHKEYNGADVLRFFKQIDASVPRGLGVHVILDNLSAHSTPEITKWLAHKDRRRWHLHFTPTCSSWLNLIERWFKELTDKRLRRGVFTSVADLTTAIIMWAQHWNENPKPFIWKANADDIITKVRRGRAALNQIIHRQTTRSAPARRHGHDPEVTFRPAGGGGVRRLPCERSRVSIAAGPGHPSRRDRPRDHPRTPPAASPAWLLITRAIRSARRSWAHAPVNRWLSSCSPPATDCTFVISRPRCTPTLLTAMECGRPRSPTSSTDCADPSSQQ